MFEDQFTGELSEEQVLFRQILLINGLATRIFGDTTTNWQVNVRNYVETINNFEATAIRHIDREYIEKKRIIVKKSQQELQRYRDANPKSTSTNQGKEFEMQLTLKYARRVFALLMITLNNKDVFNEKSYRAIQDVQDHELPGGSVTPATDPTSIQQ